MPHPEITLAFETSTPHGSLALFENGQLSGHENFHALRGHNSQIFAPLDRLLTLGQCREHGLHRIVVGIGPGSYTGIRVSIALANVLALSFGSTVQGVCSFLGAETDTDSYWVVGDARRERFFRAEIRGGLLLEPIHSEPLNVWETRVSEILTAGGRVISFDAQSPMDEIIPSKPNAVILGQRVLSLPEEIASTEPVEPLYLSAPYITVAKKPGKRIPQQSRHNFS